MIESATVLVGGDCGPVHGPADGYPIEGYTQLLRPVLERADMRFVNCMRTYSERAVRAEHAPQVGQPVAMAAIFSHGMFDAVTLANNHSCDAGFEAMLDTRRLLESRGIQVTGAGRDLAEARRAAIVERNGVRVAYLGCTAVARPGTEAQPARPGVAAVRVRTTYEPRGPHAPVRVRTEAEPDDLAPLLQDIAALRREADVVILAFHAGPTWLPRILPDYQVAVAHAAVDAGADVVVGHAPHILKAVEVYKGKAIFYSLGVFAMTKPFASPAWKEPAWAHGVLRNHADLDPTFPFMPYGSASSLSILAKVVAAKGGVRRVSFLPMAIDDRYRPEALQRNDPRFARVLAYLEWASEDMPHRFEVDGDEVLVTAGESR